jgi:hypothetical protein
MKEFPRLGFLITHQSKIEILLRTQISSNASGAGPKSRAQTSNQQTNRNIQWAPLPKKRDYFVGEVRLLGAPEDIVSF